jgi:ABC-type nitrate/sulfonate/bicarbonate transport system substrate-binding protein
MQESSALAMIAVENGYFAEEGLDCSVTEYVSGKRALTGMLRNEVDAASTAPVPVVFQSFERRDFRIVASIGAVTGLEKLVARRDLGITEPADLRGHTVGTQRGSAVHFFLHLFLLKTGIPSEEVSLKFMKAEKLPAALEEGRIDAFCMREPYISEAQSLLGEDAVVLEAPGIYYRSEFLVAMQPVVEEHPDAIRALVGGVRRASEFAEAHPDEAIGIVAGKLGVPRERIEKMWAGFRNRVSLDQSLLASMESQAEWTLKSGLTQGGRIPNYLDFLYLDALESESPEAVTIIR